YFSNLGTPDLPAGYGYPEYGAETSAGVLSLAPRRCPLLMRPWISKCTRLRESTTSHTPVSHPCDPWSNPIGSGPRIARIARMGQSSGTFSPYDGTARRAANPVAPRFGGFPHSACRERQRRPVRPVDLSVACRA